MIRSGQWRADAPPKDRVVEIWYINTVILAIWNGDCWRTTEGTALSGVSHWRVWRR
jgi:hypothetical protein